jgi:hypothetical protein
VIIYGNKLTKWMNRPSEGEKKTGVFKGGMRKRKFSRTLKTGGDRKHSVTLREYREAKAAGLVHPNQHYEPLGTHVSSRGARGNPTKKELEGALVKAQGKQMRL